ncbi:Ig-like domain-containing protein [Paenibacillus qinlingensis]|uniref:Ig-like domain-containing protein n=1 Tax=Paenibacillus qinlingensis TaxID=1837343 RepID=UPI0015656684|nr:Ig-like domain-containing protein [Paenibacillus qinlingensis]NQX61686.1 tandem-95 repeat protein [Paenibacillus qinlingensis]
MFKVGSRSYKKLGVLFVLLIFLAGMFVPAAEAAVTTNVVDINSNAMNFGTPTKVSGTDGAQGAVYLYTNVITVGGVQIDAKVTIEEKNGASLASNVLDSPDTGVLNNRLNPNVTTSEGTGSLTLKFDFFEHSSGNSIQLKNFFVTVIDIDGNSSTQKEFVELSGFASYTVNNPTGLTVSASTGGRTRFTGISTSLDGREFENTASVILNYTAPISTMNVVIGNIGTVSNRQFSINFGAKGGTFTTDKTTSNTAAPTISLSIDDGGDGKLSPSEVSAVQVSGSTTAGNGRTVTLTVKDSSNKVGYYTTTVTNTGTYTLPLDLSSYAYGTITVNADVTDSFGNPATTATDTTIRTNTKPVASGSNNATQVGIPVSGTVSATDAEGQALTYTVVTQPTHGSVVMQTNGGYTYTPTAGYTGSDSFTFKANDGLLDSDPATVTLTVTLGNTVPTATSATYSVEANHVLTGTLGGYDGDGDSLTYSVVTQPTHGTLTLDGNGYTYTPTAGYSGPDSFSYKVNDGQVDSAPATVTLTVTRANTVPTATSATYSVEANHVLTGTLGGYDADGDPLTYSVVTQPTHGTLTLDGNGYTYTPTAGYSGPDSFSYKVNDGSTDSAPATVTLTVTPENTVPTATSATYSVEAGTALTGTLGGYDADGDQLTYSVVTQPTHGTLSLDGNGYTYTPTAGYSGPDSFSYKVNDGRVDSAPATVTLTVTPANNAPTATSATYSVEAGTSLIKTLGGHDADGNQLTYIIVTQPTHGTLTLDGNGFTYTPTAGYNGPDSFSYKVNDGRVDSEPATVTLNVTLLEGWVGGRSVLESSSKWVVAPNSPLKLSAITALEATSVEATFDFALNDKVTLVLANPTSFNTDGYKLWEAVTYRLPSTVTSGTHNAIFVSKKNGLDLPAEPEAKLANNQFEVVSAVTIAGTVTDRDTHAPIVGGKVSLYDPTGTILKGSIDTDVNGHYQFTDVPTAHYRVVVEKDGYAARNRIIDALPTVAGQTTVTADFELVKYILKLKANPSSIVGDGHTKSTLSAVLTDKDGNPLQGVPVTFTAEFGTFIGSPIVLTDVNGKATIQYQSVKIEGILSQNIPVTATANDEAREIYAQEQIIVTFEPASISGIIATTKDGVRSIVPGTRVKVTKDFNGDGTIDFAAEAVTDENGSYSIAVPRGDVQYDIEVVKSVQIGNETKDFSFKQKVDVGAVTGNGSEVFESNKTLTGILVTQQTNGQKKTIDENNVDDQNYARQIRIKLRDPVTNTYVTVDGASSFALTNQGVFNVPGLTRDKVYELAIVYMIPDEENHGADKEIIINVLDNTGTLPTVKVSSDGELNILDELIDPYGDITNAETHALIDGAHVILYYANTPRNVTNHIVPNTQVVLPGIPGFAPNDNANPQTSKDGGQYAYMVYPTSDYYLVVTAPGYLTYTSPTISVEYTIVRHDIAMTPIPADTSSSSGSVYVKPETGKPNVIVNASITQSRQEENSTGFVKVEYKNDGTSKANNATVTLTLPEGAVVTNAAGGVVNGHIVVWNVGDLKVGDQGAFNVQVKYPAIKESEVLVKIKVAGKSADKDLLDPDTAQTSLQLLLFSTRGEHLDHTRFILGFPDGQFKPSKTLSRAELAAIIARLVNGGETNQKAQAKDVPTSHWASGYIHIVTTQGIFTGYDDGTFRPDIAVSREELAVVMTRFLKLEVSRPITPHFADAQGRWSAAAIEGLFRNALVNGYEDGSFKPNSPIIRLEAVTLINQLLFRGTLDNATPSFPDVTKQSWGFGQVEEATHSHVSTRKADGSESYVEAKADHIN